MPNPKENTQELLSLAYQYIELGQFEAGVKWPSQTIRIPQFVAAQNTFLKVLKIAPKNIDANVNVAMYYIDQEKFGRAFKHVRNALSQADNIPEIYFLLGECMRGLNKTEAAASAYQMAVNLKPNFFEASFNLGLILRISGKHQEAIEVFRQTLTLIPSHRTTHEHLGLTLIEQGNYVEGLRELTKGSGVIEFYNQGGEDFKNFC